MVSQPFYHLRPNKYIDRQLFIQVLINLSPIIKLHDYQYIGFGSFLFDDFKLVHNQLGISKMISLESDVNICKRANFNKPYNCIKIINQKSTDYISSMTVSQPTIIWLDYTSPREIGSQFADFCTVLNTLNHKDIIKITLNANVKALKTKNHQGSLSATHHDRSETLKGRISEFLPRGMKDDDLTENGYPKLLFRCLKKAASITFSPIQNKFLSLLLSTIYQDGQKMITLTGMILNKEENNEEITNSISNLSFVSQDWDKPCEIKVPALTPREILYINSLLPGVKIEDDIKNNHEYFFANEEGADSIRNYLEFYKYYPNFHHVIF
jgi:hypothetical protein